MNRNVIITVVIVALIIAVSALGISLYNAGKTATLTPAPSASPGERPSPASVTSAPSVSPSSNIVVDYVTSGFTPTTVTVKSGHNLTFHNSSTSALQVYSNPHPQHTENPDLNVGPVGPGQSKTVVLSRVGTWKFHNHLDPDNEGTVVVEP